MPSDSARSSGKRQACSLGGVLSSAAFNSRREVDEQRSFTCAIAAAVALSPILWQHYLVLLVVPVALARPRLSTVWLLPALLWLVPRVPDSGGYERAGPLLVAGLMVALLLFEPRRLTYVARTT